MHYRLLAALRFGLLLLVLTPAHAQQRAPSPKHELRAAWVATVLNIDYPRAGTLDAVALQEQYKNLLDQLRAVGINTVIFQVRPAADAFYRSDLVPWSRFLTGEQGIAPQGDFDPLTFYIAEAHSRGMEFHAWLNPYRVSTDLDSTKLSGKNVFYQHRDWVVPYGTRYYLNPALPEVRQHLIDVVGELVNKYDIDGLHFDDYFYPYPISGTPFPDSMQFAKDGLGFKDSSDWRRNNVNMLIERLADTIHRVKPHVAFGISPFGVWRNAADDARGSETRAGVTNYDGLYADVLKWMQEGWIDYIMPQLYWNIGFGAADYALLLQWWTRNTPTDVNLYIGHGAYKVGDNPEPAWSKSDEIPKQIDMNRRNFRSEGSAYFSAKSILANPLGLKDSLRAIYTRPALWPARERTAVRPVKPPVVEDVRYRKKDSAVRLRWEVPITQQQNRPSYYAIYRFSGDRAGTTDSPAHLLHITPIQQNCDRYEFLDYKAESGQTYTYLITAFNRVHAESSPTPSQVVRVRGPKVAKASRERKRKVRY